MLIGLAGLAAACASGGRQGPHVLPPRLAPAPPTDAIATTARSYLGVPYVSGGTSPAGFDCSGFVWFVFAERGIAVPRGVRGQFDAGRPVDAQSIQPGDLVFFATTGGGPSHVGIALGGDAFIHAPNSRGAVRVEHLGAAYWAARFLGARRVDVPHPGSLTAGRPAPVR